MKTVNFHQSTHIIRKVVLSISALCFFATMAFAQETTTSNNSNKKYKVQVSPDDAIITDVQKEKPSLKIKLEILTPVMCVGSELMFQITVINVGKKEAKVYPDSLFDTYAYRTEEMQKDMWRGMANFYYIKEQRAHLLLEPGMSHIETNFFKLDADKFQKSGKFKIVFRSYDVSSNAVEFELYDCGPTQESEKQP